MLGNLRLRRTALAALVLAAALTGCAGDDPDQVAGQKSKPLPDQVISEFGLTETSMGRKDWHMEAEKAYVYDKRNVLETDVVEVTFFDEDGSIRSVLKADYARLNRSTDDMEARGNVVVTGADGVKLETQALNWQSETRQIASDDSVTVYRNEDILTGWGFRGDPDLGSFRILKDMKATIRARDESKEGMIGGRDT
ncbi:LPS export ABC transporter periplasmic protein LptC [Candidatus Eisenbacteria bacterium]|uniref:LPS export ABC transporter periplasmic protein LptC n=1 Tax=Eiseniibacteriota bacterium TaxID=2212470 RepID=A0ABV6YMT4_UNCEI